MESLMSIINGLNNLPEIVEVFAEAFDELIFKTNIIMISVIVLFVFMFITFICVVVLMSKMSRFERKVEEFEELLDELDGMLDKKGMAVEWEIDEDGVLKRKS